MSNIPLTIDSLKNHYILDRVLGEGTFSKVVKARRVSDDQIIALKVFKKKLKSILDVDHLREVQVFKLIGDNPNFIKANGFIYDPVTSIFSLDLEIMDINLYDFLCKKYITEDKAKFIVYNVLKALEHLHSKKHFHRDIKPENILLNAEGTIVKLADLGSCSKINTEKPLTQYIATRWYRAPENLLTTGLYDEKMDIWGVSCILYEMLTKKPLFPGKNAFEQVTLINKAIGSPTEQELLEINRNQYSTLPFTFPKTNGYGLRRLFLARPSDDCISFIESALKYSPIARPSASALIKHPFLTPYNQARIQEKTKSSESFASVFYFHLEEIYWRTNRIWLYRKQKTTSY